MQVLGNAYLFWNLLRNNSGAVYSKEATKRYTPRLKS